MRESAHASQDLRCDPPAHIRVREHDALLSLVFHAGASTWRGSELQDAARSGRGSASEAAYVRACDARVNFHATVH
eukprot:672746-Alexandrium_andersonii.AAC.1